jgi:meso-butanediol dehydrogenase/(S,S)-butanediol dehydrogenase/diacetyl reductase
VRKYIEAKGAVAGGGIGRATSLAFAAGGVSHLICADINLENAEETVKQALVLGQVQSLKSATAFKVDVSKEHDIKSLFESAKALEGRIDICVNTAGVSSCRVHNHSKIYANYSFSSLAPVFQSPSVRCQ